MFNETCNTCSYSNHLTSHSPILISNKIYQLLPFDQSHPLALNRIVPVIGLAQSLNWLDESQYKESSIASVDMLARYHDIDYVEAVLSAENNRCIPVTLGKAIIWVDMEIPTFQKFLPAQLPLLARAY